jgi:hypothetical protein
MIAQTTTLPHPDIAASDGEQNKCLRQSTSLDGGRTQLVGDEGPSIDSVGLNL